MLPQALGAANRRHSREEASRALALLQRHAQGSDHHRARGSLSTQFRSAVLSKNRVLPQDRQDAANNDQADPLLTDITEMTSNHVTNNYDTADLAADALMDSYGALVHATQPVRGRHITDESEEEEGAKGWKNKLKLVVPHVVLVVFTLVYALLGAAVFYWIESPHEIASKRATAAKIRGLQASLLESAWSMTDDVKHDSLTEQQFIDRMTPKFDHLVKETFAAFRQGLRPDGIADQNNMHVTWTFMSAVFFTTTVITTIGYGEQVPVTFWGKVFCIGYALFGIPLTLITIADLGKFVSMFIIDCYKKLKTALQNLKSRMFSCLQRGAKQDSDMEMKAALTADTQSVGRQSIISARSSLSSLSLLTGAAVPASFVLLILLTYTAFSAAAFTLWEPWSFYDSFYFFFITMVTVGFGDIAPFNESYFLVSLAFIFFGLVLTTMCIDLVGSDYIDRIHYFGRRLQLAKEAFALLGGKAGNMHDWLKQMRKQHGEDFLNNPQFLAGFSMANAEFLNAFSPAELNMIKYIDHMTSTTTGTDDKYRFDKTPLSLADTMFQSLLSTLVDTLRPRGDDDFVDRLNYFVTPIMLMMAAILTSLHQYINQPLQCWLPEGWNHNMEQYIESYCWVQNTYFLPINEHIPDEYLSREERQIPYYQWVPFILVTQALMFTFPCVLWRLLNWQTGINMTQLIHTAMDIGSGGDQQSRNKTIRAAGRVVQDTLDMQAGMFMQDVVSPSKDEYHPTVGGLPHSLSNTSRTRFLTSQRYNGSFLTLLYLLIKLLYVLNVAIQLLMLNVLLQGSITPFYGWVVLRDLFSGREWFESGHFPRVTLCDFTVRTLGNINRYTVQCCLPINLFNEKVFVFFWLWLSIIATITISSFVFWSFQSLMKVQRRDFVLRFLCVAASNVRRRPQHDDNKMLFMSPMCNYHRFIDDYIKTDGTFILRVLCNHVGDVITMEIIKHLWREYRVRQQQHDAAILTAVHEQAAGAATVAAGGATMPQPQASTDSLYKFSQARVVASTTPVRHATRVDMHSTTAAATGTDAMQYAAWPPQQTSVISRTSSIDDDAPPYTAAD